MADDDETEKLWARDNQNALDFLRRHSLLLDRTGGEWHADDMAPLDPSDYTIALDCYDMTVYVDVMPGETDGRSLAKDLRDAADDLDVEHEIGMLFGNEAVYLQRRDGRLTANGLADGVHLDCQRMLDEKKELLRIALKAEQDAEPGDRQRKN